MAADSMDALILLALLATPFILLGAVVAGLIVQIGSETASRGVHR
jgi:hypothetical protein